MKPDRAPKFDAGAVLPKPGEGLLGVMLRCIGWAVDGAVRVVGGADQVMLPRLPMEPPLPARASASPGTRARLRAATAASRVDDRRMALSRLLVNLANMVMSRFTRQPK
jgi:hypothetical protein